MAEFDRTPSEAALERVRKAYVGKPLQDLPTPAAILDKRVAAAHCTQMLQACKTLGVALRAHIKTHKTLEVSKLQVDANAASPIRLIVSTLPEIKLIQPWLVEQEAQGREVSILYSMPLPPSTIPALSAFASGFQKSQSLAIMVDHPEHIALAPHFHSPISCFLKIDTGLHRAGVPATSVEFEELAKLSVQADRAGHMQLLGVYSHASHSYGVRDAEKAMLMLRDEILGCLDALSVLRKQPGFAERSAPLLLSVGATPTATSAQNLVAGVQAAQSAAAHLLRQLLSSIAQDPSVQLELHAGVYPFLDLQQLSTRAAPSLQAPVQDLEPADVAFTVLAEVASLYPHRQPPQAMLAAGSLALGREPCPRYTGFGAISAWGLEHSQIRADPGAWGGGSGRSGWVVGKVSQEHGVLMPEEESGWEGTRRDGKSMELPFRIGQKLRVLPNHACIAGSGYPWYFVTDGDDKVVDIWPRCGGW